MAECICFRSLNKKMVPLRLTGTPDAAGHIDETDEANWIPLSQAKSVQLVPKGSREFFRGQQVAAEITHQVTMRLSKETQRITTKDRLKYGSRRFNIAGPPVNVDEKDLYLRFPAIEVP